ncbi:MAG: hypothetical protein FWD37_01010, partial [Methanomassiliicoccaceae archaeon]|nr:hypothetical protein [Methanomassiliicoccaceae archaeon]
MDAQRTITIALALFFLMPLSAVVTAEVIDTYDNCRLGAPGTGILDIDGSGTERDPYRISSASDLKKMSETHFLHNGAFYEQISDVIFDNFSNDMMTIDVIIDDDVNITLIPEAECSALYAYVSLNGCFEPVIWDEGKGTVNFDIGVIKKKNTVAVVGYTDHTDLAFVLNFTESFSETVPFFGNHIPIGSSDRPFTGSYNGNGYSIIGMKAVSEKNSGMFGYVENAILYDMNITSVQGNSSYMIAAVTKDPFVTPDMRAITASAGGFAGNANDLSMISCSADCAVMTSLTAI